MRNKNVKAIGKCLVHNYHLGTMEEMLYCGVSIDTNGKQFHMVKRYGRGQRPINILVGSKTTKVYIEE